MRNKNVTVLLAFSLILLASCTRAKQANQTAVAAGVMTEIKGLLKDGAGTRVVLEEMAPREFIPVDTVNCDESGVFTIRFESTKTAFYVLRTGLSGYITLLLEPGEQLLFNGSSIKPEEYTLEGSRGSELLMELAHKHKNALNELGTISRKNVELQSAPDYVDRKRELDLRFDSITGAFHKTSLEFIHNNKESLSVLVALYNLYGEGLPVFPPDEDLEVYRYVDSVLSIHFSDFEAVELLHAQVLEAEAARSKPAQNPGLALGEIAPDFVSSTPGGGQVALSELRGNYVLLSFWAGWSSMSREENPTLRKAWEKFGQQRFRILQVSFDGDRQVWLDAIEQDGLEWDHVSMLRRWETVVADLYLVEKIPANYLIDPAGKIAGVDLFGNELIDNLEQIFSKK